MISHKQKDGLMFLARLIIGGIFLMTGWQKVSAMDRTIAFFATIGLPAFLAYLVAYVELIGGALLVLGLWLERIAAILAIVMLAAVYYTRAGGLMAYGFPLAILAALLLLLSAGPGAYVFRSKKS